MARVLVVDDEVDVLRLVSMTLELDGHQVFMASDGLEALQVAADERPDLVVLDVMMPNMDGLSTLRHLRGGPLAHVPVLLLSAKSQPRDIEEGMTAGAVGYLAKPFEPEELSSEVARITSG